MHFYNILTVGQFSRKLSHIIILFITQVRHNSWIGKYPGLAYSISQDGAYCLFCLLFVCDKNEHAVLIRKPYRDWKHATELFNAHYFDLRSDKKSSYGYETDKMCAESALTLQRVVMNAQCTVYHAVLYIRIMHNLACVYADLLFSSYISRFLQRIMMTMAHTECVRVRN